MMTRALVAAMLTLFAVPVLASDASADQRSQTVPSQKCTCPCAQGHETQRSDSRAQPPVDYGETASWPAY
jgi:hypothetical protein